LAIGIAGIGYVGLEAKRYQESAEHSLENANPNRRSGHRSAKADTQDGDLLGQLDIPRLSGIAGHRDTFFRGLRGVRDGDQHELKTAAGLMHYKADQVGVGNYGPGRMVA
jgi:sortase (surface protein transpeptidase)